MFFQGEFNYSIDEKGRLNFPSKHRELMDGEFTIVQWLDNCLAAYPNKRWATIGERFSSKSNNKLRDASRHLFSAAANVTPDKQGRILVPQNLREYAKLKKEVTIIGVGDHAEIWDTTEWKKRSATLTAELLAAVIDELDM